MAFLEFFNKHKDQETNLVNKSSSEHSVLYPFSHNYANRNVAKLFQAQSLDHQDNEETTNKRNSKSEENIFEKIETGTKKYGTLPKHKLYSNENAEDYEKIETEEQLSATLHDRLNLRKNSDEIDRSTKLSSSLEYNSSSTTSSAEYLDQHSDSDKMMSSTATHVMTDAQGLIVPKKLINPCLESSDRQNLHRELMFNQKVGKNVLNQKSELQRALEKQKERQMMAAQQKKEEHTIENELSKVIMQRAQRLENSQKENKNHDDLDDHYISPEYLNARAKLKHTIDLK